jgi:hypothetical protein
MMILVTVTHPNRCCNKPTMCAAQHDGAKKKKEKRCLAHLPSQLTEKSVVCVFV